jgi:hypothetical protein
VVDEEPTPDRCAGVDVDPGPEVDDLAQQPRQNRHPPAPQRVDRAMRDDRVESGIRKDDVEPAVGGWIALDRRTQVG